MLNSYTILKTIHVLAVAVWLGGGVMLLVLAVRARRAASPEALVQVFRDGSAVAPRLFVPASLVLLLTGFAMVGDADIGFELWIVLALVGWAITFVTGVAVLTPQSKRADRALAEHGPQSPEALGEVTKFLGLVRIDLVVLTLVVADMVIKPG